MDELTLLAYDRGASDYARDWHAQPVPDDLYALLRQYFQPGPTADVGSGSGRDAAWLASQGLPVIGYDPSHGLWAEAARRYPGIPFVEASLPRLAGVPDGYFTNVLCETVLMHLPHESVMPAVRRLVAILRPGGTLCLSWRVTVGDDQRDGAGRLYAAVDPDVVRAGLGRMSILHERETTSASSEKIVHRILARRPAFAATAWQDPA